MAKLMGRWVASLGKWVAKLMGRWVAKLMGRWGASLGRWVAELVARLLVTAALWVRIETSLKNTKRATSAQEGPKHSSPLKNI